ncbi:MAG: FecR domain-containing protein [Polyangiaceae bacterium]
MRSGLRVLAGAACALLLVGSLHGCRGESSLAVLKGKEGTVDASRGSRDAAFKAAVLGMSFVLGDAVRTAHASTAKLDLDDGSKLLLRQDTVLRFLAQRPKAGRQAFDVEAGEVIVETGKSELVLETGGKIARVAPSSRLSLLRARGELAFAVTVGRAELEGEGEPRVLTTGQSISVALGAALLEDAPSGPSASASSAIAKTNSADTGSRGDELVAQIFGNGVRIKPTKANGFETVPSGTREVAAGTTLQVDGSSRVEVASRGAKVDLTSSGIYVLGTAQGLAEVRRGTLTASGVVRIRVPGGVIETTVPAGFNVRTSDAGSSEIQVARGVVTVTTAVGQTTISAGQAAVVSSDGQTHVEGASLAYSDLVVQAGDSLSVHDPRPPTAVRFEFGSLCPTGGVVRIASKRKSFAVGQTSVSLGLPAGQQAYTLHCLGSNGPHEAPKAKGTITVLSDAATRPVPTRPPSTSLNIDGRTYTVTYQNQLPNLSVQWPGAPEDGSYTIGVETRRMLRKFHSTVPSYTFRSGTLAEGQHTIHFEGGGKFSRHTTVEIVFDNAAPKVSLLTPPELRVAPGEEVSVTGVAQPGWSVSVGGRAVALDGQQRFTEKVTMPVNERALAITLTNPERGTHVYLRRASRQP